MDLIGFSSLNDFKFSYNRVYPVMVVKNVQIHGINTWNMDLQVKESKVDISTTPRQNSIALSQYFQNM